MNIGGVGMNLSEKIKDGRKKSNFTQQELADRLHVTRQALSKWENDQSYPNLDILVNISKILRISLNELLGENHEMVEQISNDVRSKHKYMKYLYIVSGAFVLSLLISCAMLFFAYGEETHSVAFDRFNPSLKTEQGYAILPKKTPSQIIKNNYNKKDYRKYVNHPEKIYSYVHDADGKGEYLNFATGFYDANHRWAKVVHKGSYVSKAELISKDEIPSNIRKNISDSYENYGVKN
ncbi:helix-turn-helix domain-containing protein [Apilactobacillus micheneri]|uniref:Helix-turn-helix domain-containing protein n=2 Tax=Apilactobacillus micheneri TaxID=1899430 RepID=A0A9Q8IMA8_9LACO|nr:helix-turn-helix domain-containing protein [Apilactobacillus micheneri]TPR41782.1 helix-turn-helix domain-containing protein [Apilactobacillus micheneri]TPR44171.1 helix-turn-helix domain-containing protein [Apilactobacillus micheneri]TPR45795.1 helix-turn-helix domain-containing protein [Apilactobacillus micheneri]TPR50539.1 helix-turn-helix domain-containing protein [Apilactobacillus micheneri]